MHYQCYIPAVKNVQPFYGEPNQPTPHLFVIEIKKDFDIAEPIEAYLAESASKRLFSCLSSPAAFLRRCAVDVVASWI